ncbi:hypothetical protein CPB85DRAFT_1272507 [Mucidula mucida]|nr:hypothetical protein CPB85DRAFT_1272507 [Mucidula mucida]
MQSHHVFRLPVEIIDTLTPRNLWNQSAPENDTQEALSPKPKPTSLAPGSKSCNICNGVNFIDVEEQRSHYRSDWHRLRSDAVAALVSRTKHRRSSSTSNQVRAPAQTAVTCEETTQGHKKKPKRPKPEIEVVKHKTFHRYTTRRKQGGSQGLNDNAKGNAKSAGAQLRRYGEQALRDVRRYDDCERIWIRASGTNRKIFMDYDGCAIAKGDQRLRTFPFPTRRPTQAELTRCLNELTKVKVSHLTEDALRAQDEAYIASLPKPKPVPVAAAKPQVEKEKAPKLSKEEEALRDKWDRLLDMVRKGRVEPLKSFWEKQGESMGGLDVRIPEWADERWDTLLQLASHCDQEEMVQWLLESRADPTIPVSPQEGDSPEQSKFDRRTAYDLAHNRSVRDVFRRAAGDHPDWWDWFGARGSRARKRRRSAEEGSERSSPRSARPVQNLQYRHSPCGAFRAPKTWRLSGAAEGVMGLTPEMRPRLKGTARSSC